MNLNKSTTMPPPPFTKGFQVFSERVEELHRQWVMWRRLYLLDDAGKKAYDASLERLRILEKAAPQVFGHCRAALLRDVVLRLCHLADPKEDARGNTNLTIERVFDEIDFSSPCGAAWCVYIQQAKTNALEQVGHMRDLRRKELAHLDLPTAMGEQVNDVEIETIRLAVDWVLEFRHQVRKLREGELPDISAPTGERGSVAPPRQLERPWIQEVDRLVEALGAGLASIEAADVEGALPHSLINSEGSGSSLSRARPPEG